VDTKIIGYPLLIFGLVLIVLSLFSVYQVLTSRAKPVVLFNQSSISFDPGSLLAGQLPSGIKTPSSQVELLSAATINDMLNLTFHVVLMSFVLSVGTKIATIGIQLIRPVEVKLRANEPQSK
jgi:hypothetical protein